MEIAFDGLRVILEQNGEYWSYKIKTSHGRIVWSNFGFVTKQSAINSIGVFFINRLYNKFEKRSS